MADITAEESGKALGVIADKMVNASILTAEGGSVLREEGLKLKRKRRDTSWGIAIARERPIAFERAADKNGDPIKIFVSAEGIKVVQSGDDKPPFETLDVAVQMEDLAGKPVCKWHMDRANLGQSGPLFHLQFGGHHPGFRDEDFPIKEPRWCHPPMELALVCEMISANFFEASWKKSLRDDPAWCQAIRLAQKLCYSDYSRRLSDSLNVSDSTALGRMWNDRWI